MWKRLADPNKEDEAFLRSVKKAKIYADEDIEEEAVEWIRSRGVNIKSARELGHRGKPDSFHAALAFKEKRFLLTKNEKDFFDNAAVPFHRTHGVIAIHGDMSNMLDYAIAIEHLLQLIVQYGEMFAGSKIRLKPNEMMVRGIDHTGRSYTQRFKFEKDGDYIWVENEAE
jgi:predicted nuclease of predicted toxin-antitoxin system